MSDRAHSNDQSPSDRIETQLQKASTSEHLMPSMQDFRDFKNDSNRQSYDVCGPDYTRSENSNGETFLNPTQKRLELDRQARESINTLDDNSLGPASEKERDAAAKVAELANKAQEDLKTSTIDDKRDQDIRSLVDIFKGLDPASAQRVIAETNKLLGGDNLRFAQTPAGEIWMGSRNSDKTPYFLNARVKEAPCAPVA